MKINPFSWFSDWADKLGMPTWALIVLAVFGGLLALFMLGFFR